jgi:hypothetical protein
MDRPNLFDFATSELSQDAFLCWLLSWANRKYRVTDEALHRTAYALLGRLLARGKLNALGEIEALEVRRQYKNIDILVLVNTDLALLIEDKTDTAEGPGQLQKYLDTVRRDFPGRKVAAIFFKTGDQCNYDTVEQAGFTCFLRRDFLDVLGQSERLDITNNIFTDFHRYLRNIEEVVSSYRSVPLQDWNKVWHCWKGFFMVLRERLGDGGWNYVANPSGGFMGFWWHWNGNKYLQLEQEQLCFKIMVEDKAQQAAAWNEWHRLLMAESQDAELRLRRPRRRKNGTWMTVAVLDGQYRQADESGVLDLDRTVTLLKKAEALLDSAAAKAS